MVAQAFCPGCGGPLVERLIEAEGRDRLLCQACGRIHYLNPKIVAGTVPVAGERVWLLRRGIEPRYGYWTVPAGFMEMGESVEEAARRETWEELSITVRLGPLLGIYSAPHLATVHIIYQAEALDQPGGGSETLEYRAFLPAEIPWDELAFWSTRRALEDWVALNAAG